MSSTDGLIRALYHAFNARDIDSALAKFSPNVNWPNGMEGGRVHGREAVRKYWLRQWALIDPKVEPERLVEDRSGKTVVDVHQVVRDLNGMILVDRRVRHVFTLRDGLVERMDIEEVELAENHPHPVARDVTAFVLTGGKSQRMGQDKALLRLPSGTTLLEHAVGVAGAVADQVGIVGARNKYAAYAWAGEIIEDIFPERGPLGGIHAALQASTTDLNIILAVDLPRITVQLLSWMLEQSRQSGAEITIAETAGGRHPLCGIYRRSFRERVEEALRQGHNKVDRAFDPGALRLVSENELRDAGFPPELFTNVNTPEEFQSLSAGK